MSTLPLAVLNEHPAWQERLYAELRRRSMPFVELPLHTHHFDPSVRTSPYPMVINRASPSAWKRGHASAIFFAQSALAYYAWAGARVVNGHDAYLLETSKALQAMLLEGLGVRTPRTRVANSAEAVRAAAEGLVYPLVVKPNIGGSGAGITRFDDRDALEAYLAAGPSFGIDGTVLVQEFHPAADDHIVRVEMLGDRHLYSVRIYPDTSDFNLCPADMCRVGPAESPAEAAPDASAGDEFAVCLAEAPKKLRIERHDEAPEVVETARAIAKAGKLDVCGIEYLVSTRDGQRYFYDVNALSNFVRDAEEVVGFDPTRVFVDWIEAELAAAR
jgi:glutathione synthase/RimK-type ligase-like ATP-grasp enzyme